MGLVDCKKSELSFSTEKQASPVTMCCLTLSFAVVHFNSDCISMPLENQQI